MKTFTLFWIDGKKEIIRGDSITSAFTSAGYGRGAMIALDFYAEGESDDYRYNTMELRWKLKDEIKRNLINSIPISKN
jgi:hypothetical protein